MPRTEHQFERKSSFRETLRPMMPTIEKMIREERLTIQQAVRKLKMCGMDSFRTFLRDEYPILFQVAVENGKQRQLSQKGN